MMIGEMTAEIIVEMSDEMLGETSVEMIEEMTEESVILKNSVIKKGRANQIVDLLLFLLPHSILWLH